MVTSILLFGCGGNFSSISTTDDCSRFIGTWETLILKMEISKENDLIIVKIRYYYDLDGKYSATCQDGKLQINVPNVGPLDLTIDGTGKKLFFYKDDWVKQ